MFVVGLLFFFQYTSPKCFLSYLYTHTCGFGWALEEKDFLIKIFYRNFLDLCVGLLYA